MKKQLMNIIAVMLSALMVIGLSIPAVVAAENNQVSYSLDVSESAVTNEADKTVTISINLDDAIEASSLGYKVVCEGLELVGVTAADGSACNIASSDVNKVSNQELIVSWQQATMANASIDNIGVITVKIPAGTTPAQYTIDVVSITASKDYSVNKVIVNDSISTTITVTEPTTPSLYTLSAPGYDAENGVAVGEIVQLELTINQAFNCAEIEINYPADYVEYQAKEKWVDGADRIEVEQGENSLKLLHIGAAKENYTYVLEFKAIKAVETAEFSVTSMAFGTTSEAIETGAATKVDANLLPTPYRIKIVEGYTIELDDIFESEQTAVAHGKSFSFTIESKTGEYYKDYTVTSVTMGGNALAEGQLTHDEANNTWTIANVTGNLVIEGERTAKSYTVEWEDDKEIDVIPSETEEKKEATYGTDFAFNVPEKTGYTISVVAKIGENTVGEFDSETRVYSIKGTDITGDITITVTATELEDITITVSGSGVVIKGTDGAGLTSTSVKAGTEVTLVLTPAFGYTYSVVVGSGAPVDFNENNEYTFTAQTSDADPETEEKIVVTVTKTLNYTANVSQYVQLDGTSMWLVTIGNGDAPLTHDNKNYTFKYTFGDETVTMSWSDNYKAYAALVIANANPAESLTYDLVGDVPTVTKITYDYNINGSANNSVDINDAQLVWNMYNQIYKDVTNNVTLEKFWKADVNKDKMINVEDALVIINAILSAN